jgi:hydrogenase maturation factor
MAFKENVNLVADIFSIILSLIAIVGLVAAHRTGVLHALSDMGARAKHEIEIIEENLHIPPSINPHYSE